MAESDFVWGKEGKKGGKQNEKRERKSVGRSRVCLERKLWGVNIRSCKAG